jgi:hypothetical protein
MKNKIRIRRFLYVFGKDGQNEFMFNLYPSRNNWSERTFSFNDLTEAEIIKNYFNSAFMSWVNNSNFPEELAWSTIKAIEVDTNDEQAEDKYILELYKVFIIIKLIMNKANKNNSFEELLQLGIDELETMHDEPIVELRINNLKINELNNKKFQIEEEKKDGFFTRWFRFKSTKDI